MKEKNPLLTFFIGVVMLAAGLYWLFTSVTVTASYGYGSIHIGGFSMPSGLVVVPLIIGVFWLIVNPKSFLAKVLTVAGVVFIIASIIMSVRLVFERKSLFEYIIMLILIVGGAGCLARVLLTGEGSDKDKKD